ncbi:MAG: lamin tail domain-containing protein, partial [Verrucomicrobiota bacterium]
EISEVVALNERGLVDEFGQTEDWVEIRHTGTEPLALDGLFLVQDFFSEDVFAFPSGLVLEPGDHLVVFLDNDVGDGPFHAPFRQNAAGEDLLLVRENQRGIRQLVSQVSVPMLEADQAYARVGAGGDFVRTMATTPGGANLQEPVRINFSREGSALQLTLLFATESGIPFIVESSPTMGRDDWEPVLEGLGNGIEQAVRFAVERERYFRVGTGGLAE